MASRAEARAQQARKHAARREGEAVRGRCGDKDFVVKSWSLHVECPECRAVMAVTDEARPRGGRRRKKSEAEEPKPPGDDEGK